MEGLPRDIIQHLSGFIGLVSLVHWSRASKCMRNLVLKNTRLQRKTSALTGEWLYALCENHSWTDAIVRNFVREGEEEIVVFLASIPMNFNVTPISEAACYGHEEMCSALLDVYGGKNKTEVLNDMVLGALQGGHFEFVKKWLPATDSEFFDEAVYHASLSENRELIAFAQRVAQREDWDNVYLAACSRGNIDMARWAMQYQNMHTPFALKYAVHGGNASMVQWLVDQGMNLCSSDDLLSETEYPLDGLCVLLREGKVNDEGIFLLFVHCVELHHFNNAEWLLKNHIIDMADAMSALLHSRESSVVSIQWMLERGATFPENFCTPSVERFLNKKGVVVFIVH